MAESFSSASQGDQEVELKGLAEEHLLQKASWQNVIVKVMKGELDSRHPPLRSGRTAQDPL